MRVEILEREAQELTEKINQRLAREGVRTGQAWAIGAIVAEIAPRWDYLERSTMGDMTARVVLTTYDPRPD